MSSKMVFRVVKIQRNTLDGVSKMCLSTLLMEVEAGSCLNTVDYNYTYWNGVVLVNETSLG